MKTVADFVSARIASFCIEVFAGRTPFAIRCTIERGSSRSCETRSVDVTSGKPGARHQCVVFETVQSRCAFHSSQYVENEAIMQVETEAYSHQWL